VVAAAAVVEVGDELKQLDEDHVRKEQRREVGDEVVDVAGNGEDATTKKTTVGITAHRRVDASTVLRTP